MAKENSKGKSWKIQGGEDAPEPKTFSDADVEGFLGLTGERQETPIFSNICMVLYGLDGVGKTGVALDSRTKEEREAGKKIIVYDLDGSAGPLKTAYFGNDENIVVFDPFVLTETGQIDYVTTYNKILAVTRYLMENEDAMNMASVVLDGLDTLLKICEYVMRYEDLKMDPDTQVKDSWQWQRRNRRYLTVVMLLKKLKCRKFYTTHLKPDYQWQKAGKKSELSVVGYKPDWEKSTPGIMFQKVHLVRREIAEQDEVVIEAKVEKAKGALHLEGKEYTVARVMKGKTSWNGLTEFFQEVERSMGPE